MREAFWIFFTSLLHHISACLYLNVRRLTLPLFISLGRVCLAPTPCLSTSNYGKVEELLNLHIQKKKKNEKKINKKKKTWYSELQDFFNFSHLHILWTYTNERTNEQSEIYLELPLQLKKCWETKVLKGIIDLYRE